MLLNHFNCAAQNIFSILMVKTWRTAVSHINQHYQVVVLQRKGGFTLTRTTTLPVTQLLFKSCDAQKADHSTTVQQKKYLLRGMKKQYVAAVHLSVSGTWETDCDRRCLAQVSPSLLSVPCHIWRQIGCGTVWLAPQQVSWWAGVMDEAEQDAAPSLPAPLVSVPMHRGDPPPVTSLRDALSPPRAPRWGKWWLKRATHQQQTQRPVCPVPFSWRWRKTERSDGQMMYLQTVEQRKSVTAGAEAHVTRRSRKRRTWEREDRWDLGVLTFTFKQLHLKPLFEVRTYKTTWSQQTFGQNRNLSPPRMKSNPFSPGQTCDFKPGICCTH